MHVACAEVFMGFVFVTVAVVHRGCDDYCDNIVRTEELWEVTLTVVHQPCTGGLGRLW